MFRFLPLLLCLVLGQAHAQAAVEPDPDAGIALEYEQTIALALQAQPLLEGLAAEVRAARAEAIAARQLPDPQLFGAVRDLPLDTDDAYSLTRDSDTQIVVGVMQEFPLARKRELRGAQRELDAVRLEAMQALARRQIRRDAALDWLALWRAEQARSLIRQTRDAAALQARALGIALSTGRASQAELLATQVEQAQLDDELSAREQALEMARAQLSRWIGVAAERPVCPDLPASMPLPSEALLLAGLDAHPELAAQRAGLARAEAGTGLARAGYRPDWRLEVGYGHRPAFSEMLMVQVGVDLPVFTRNRQDQALDSARAMEASARAALEDTRRQLQAQARQAQRERARLGQRLQHFDDRILPAAAQRTQAALAAWRAGRGSLDQVQAARRAELELQLARLDLQYDAAVRDTQLLYLATTADPE
jgi:outer membrane protein, heavy metal efflux system